VEEGFEPSPTLLDPATGVFNEAFFRATFALRIAAGRRLLRPIAVVLIEVTGIDPVAVAGIISTTLRDADVAARLDSGAFALLLEDTPENGAVWTAERIRRALQTTPGGPMLRAGVAGYPAQAFEAHVILDCAIQALAAARDWPQDRIEVA
jgi:GGDEF domain-containing protein